MFGHATDRDWNAFGVVDPYWSILAYDGFTQPGTSDSEKQELFFYSGQRYVDQMWDIIESHLVRGFHPQRALDFGCGMGRIAIPLAHRCGSVVGVDVAESMLVQARALCAERGISNVTYARSDDTLSAVSGRFDLIHTYIVLQHIASHRGLKLIHNLVDRLNTDGVGVLHVLYRNGDTARPARKWLKHIWRLARRPFLTRPLMQMNPYPLQEVFRIIQDAGIRQMHVLTTDHSAGCLGLVLYFRKDPDADYLA